MRLGAKGMKIRLGGRLGGAEMARIAWERDGRVPLQTIRSDIDYGQVHAHTTYGRIGVKVWIYKGDVIGDIRPGDDLAAGRGREGGRDGGGRPAPQGQRPAGGAPPPALARPAAGAPARPVRPAEGIGANTSPNAPAPAVTAGFNNNVTIPAPERPPVEGAFGDAGYVSPGPPSEEAITVGNDAMEVLEAMLPQETEGRTALNVESTDTPAHAENLADAFVAVGLVTEDEAVAATSDDTDTTPATAQYAGSQGDEADITTPSQAEGARDDADEGDTSLSQAAGADDNLGLTDEVPGASGSEGAPNVADTNGEEG
jgi:hypothetical protein